MEFKIIDITKIKPNTYNPNEMVERIFEHLKAEISRIGFLDPVLVREENNEYIIVDGEHRWKASQEAGLKEIPVVIVNMSETEAMIETYNANAIKGMINPLKFAKLIDDLKEIYSIEEMSKHFNIDPVILEGYEILLDIPEQTMDDYTVIKKAKDTDFIILKVEMNIDESVIFEEALVKTEETTLEKQFMTLINKWEAKNDKRNTQ